MDDEFEWEEPLLDHLMDVAIETVAERERDYRDMVRHDWLRALEEPAPDRPGYIVLCYDGDQAGGRAMEEAFLNLLHATPSGKNYLRSFCLLGEPYETAIRWLSNDELFTEYRFNGEWESYLRTAEGIDDDTARAWIAQTRQWKQACILLINERSEEATEYHHKSGTSPAARFNSEHSITEVLSMFDIQAVPGKNISCPAHEDSSPSCTVFAHDQRIFCHAAHCILNGGGKGEDAYGLYRVLSETTK